MARFVRRNLITFSSTFALRDTDNDEIAGISDPSPDADDIQPASATAQLSYHNLLGQFTVVSFPLTKDANNVWSGQWDSTDAQPGRVEWVIFSSGGVVAAQEGSFQLFANDANMGSDFDG